MSRVYGLTGGIASGKTTVLDILKKNGCKTYDADQVARQVVVPGSVGLREITKQFSKHILSTDGSLDRKKLGRIVFSDRRQLRKLTGITGPLIRKQILKMISDMKKDPDPVINIFEIPLLFEGKYQSYFDATISIYLDPQIQLKRLMKRNNLDEVAAKKKIESQMSMDQKRLLADFSIDNSQDLTHLETEILQLLKKL